MESESNKKEHGSEDISEKEISSEFFALFTGFCFWMKIRDTGKIGL